MEPLIILSPDEVIDLQDGLTLLSYDKNIRIFVDTVSSNIVYCKPKLNKPDNPSTQIGILNMIPAFNKGSQTKKTTTSHTAASNLHQESSIPTKVSPNATDQKVNNMGCTTPLEGNVSNPTNDPQINKACPNTSHPAANSSSQQDPMDIIGTLFCHKDKLPSSSNTAVTKAKRDQPNHEDRSRSPHIINTSDTRINHADQDEVKDDNEALIDLCTRRPTRPSLYIPPSKRQKLLPPKNNFN